MRPDKNKLGNLVIPSFFIHGQLTLPTKEERPRHEYPGCCTLSVLLVIRMYSFWFVEIHSWCQQYVCAFV
jgi:hypothetical protein